MRSAVLQRSPRPGCRRRAPTPRPRCMSVILQLHVSSMTGAEWPMSFDWLAWSNPVAIWWGFLVIVSGANIALLLLLHRWLRERAPNRQLGTRVELLLVLL